MLINQIPFFVIENQNLYKEQVLVEYSWYPIFFVCTTDINDHYIVLYAEINDTVKYLIISVPDTELSLMLHGQILMKDIFLHRECYWEVTAGDDTTKDTVNKKRISDLDEAMLPTGSFEILTKEVSEYVKKLDERIRREKNTCL